MANDPDIVIREVMGEKRIAFRGLESLDIAEKDDENWIEDYEDALIELSEIEDEYDGLELAWHAGRVVDQADKAKLAKLLRHSEIDIGDPYTLQRYRNFYQMFENEDYDSSVPQSVYTELAVEERMDGAREAYDRLQEADEVPRVYEARAWGKCYEDSDFSLENVAERVLKESNTQTSNVGAEKLAEGVRRVFLMAGKDHSAIDADSVQQFVTQ